MDIVTFLISFIVIIGSVILHEIAHGYVAYRCGDSTAKLDGRLTLNPIPHIDPIGTLLIPFMFFLINSVSGVIVPAFGWAKPVPVNYYNLRGGERDYFWVSIAGIIVNIGLAIIGALLFRVIESGTMFDTGIISYIAISLVFYNILLALFNLVPIPPLDGSRLLRTILPSEYKHTLDQLEPYGMFLIFGFLWLFMGRLSTSVYAIASAMLGI